MTGPNPIHIVPVQGVGGELLDAVKPLIEAMDRKRQLEMAQQEFALRKKQADLAQQEHDEALQRLIQTGVLVKAATNASTAGYTGPSIAELVNAADPTVVGQPQVAEMIGKMGTNVASVEDRRQKIFLDHLVHESVANWTHGPMTKEGFTKVLSDIASYRPEQAQQLANVFASYFPDWEIHVNEDGTVAWLDKNHPGNMRGQIESAPPTQEQIRLAQYGTAELDSHALMTKLLDEDPEIGSRVSAHIRGLQAIAKVTFVGAGYPGHFGVGVGGAGPFFNVLLEPGVKRGMTAKEQQFLEAEVLFANSRLRNVSGATINQEELGREAEPFIPQAGEEHNPDLIAQKAQSRAAEAMGNVTNAMRAFDPRRLSRLGQIYYNAFQASLAAPDAHTAMPEPTAEEAAAQAVIRASGVPTYPQTPQRATPKGPPVIPGIESPEQALERIRAEQARQQAKQKKLTQKQQDSAALGKLFGP